MDYRTSIRALFEAVVTENKKKIEALADKGNKRAQNYLKGRDYAKQQGVDHAKAHGNSDWATGVKSLARDREQAMTGGKSLALIGAQRISHNERPLVINTKPTGPTYRLGSSGVSKMDKGYLSREGRRSMRALIRDKGARPNQPSEEERYLPKQEGTIMDYRTSIRALFEAVLNEEGFEYQKPGQLSKSKRNQAEYQDRRERELSGRIVMRGGGNLLDKDIMHRPSARALRAIKDKSPHSVDRYGNPRSVPDTHTFMNLAHVKADREAKRKAREERLARKAEAAAKAAAKAQQQNSSTDHSRDNLRAIFEAIVNESRKGYMARLGKKPTKNPTTGKTEYMSDKELGKAVKTKDQGSDWSGQEPKFTKKEALKSLGSTQRKFFDPKKKK